MLYQDTPSFAMFMSEFYFTSVWHSEAELKHAFFILRIRSLVTFCNAGPAKWENAEGRSVLSWGLELFPELDLL